MVLPVVEDQYTTWYLVKYKNKQTNLKNETANIMRPPTITTKPNPNIETSPGSVISILLILCDVNKSKGELI